MQTDTLFQAGSVRRLWLDEEGVRCGWSADEGREFSAGQVSRLHDVSGRPDGDVRRDVLRMLLLDSLVPMTVDAWVSAGVVTLTGTVSSEAEREDAKYLAGQVPGVFGVLDELTSRPDPGADDDQTEEEVAAALARTAIADVADVTVDVPSPGTVVLSGAVQSRSDHDLAVATAWSVARVAAVDDCILVEAA